MERDLDHIELNVKFHGDDEAILSFVENGKEKHELQRYSENYDQSLNRLIDITEKINNRGCLILDGYNLLYFVQEDLFHRVFIPLEKYSELLQTIRLYKTVSIEGCPSSLRPILSANRKILSVHFKDSLHQKIRKIRGYLSTIFMETILLVVNLLMICKFVWLKNYILLYSIDQVSPGMDCDFRIEGLYRELRRRKVNFLEILHTSNHKTSIKNIFRRKRAGLVIETSFLNSMIVRLTKLRSKMSGFIHSKDATSKMFVDDFEFFENILISILCTSYAKYILLKWYIKHLNPTICLVVDDGRHANELVAILKDKNLPCIGYQHGLTFNKYFVGLYGYRFKGKKSHAFDLYGFWSSYFREKMVCLSDLYNDSNTFVFGMIRSHHDPPEKRKILHQPLVVLVISEPKLKKGDIDRYMCEIRKDQDLKIVLRVRPGEDLSVTQKLYSEIWDVSDVDDKMPIREALASCDVVVGAYSSVLYEAVFFMKPVVMIKTNNFFRPADLCENGLVSDCKDPASLCEDIKNAAKISDSELRARRFSVWGDAKENGCSLLIEKAFIELESRRTKPA